jgi:hypothetical protein
MTIEFKPVDSLLNEYKSQFEHGAFSYSDPDLKFRSIVGAHFAKAKGKIYGVYVVSQSDNREIVYIGKGGTIDGHGQFRGQDVPGRLRNIRGKDERADQWFLDLLCECGPLTIEYLVVEAPISPAYIEVALLQAFLAQHHRLPAKNSSL